MADKKKENTKEIKGFTDTDFGTKDSEKHKKSLDENVKRGEVIQIMQQFVDNFNKSTDYLMKDINTMYAKQVFPFQIKLSIMEDILKEKNLTDDKDLQKRYVEKLKLLKAQAREVKEDKNGNLKVVSKAQEKKDIKAKVARALGGTTDNVVRGDFTVKQ